jgi:hypothetical protein
MMPSLSLQHFPYFLLESLNLNHQHLKASGLVKAIPLIDLLISQHVLALRLSQRQFIP